MALRYEAWSTPWDPGGFHRKVSMLPTIDGSGQGSKGFLSFPGDSSVDLSLANFDRLDELVSDSESSLITVYDCDHDGTNTIIDEWILDRVPSRLKSDREVSLSGGGLLSVFEKALVYAFDYPKNPASQGDHVWGGDNILANPDFEDVNSSPKQVELVVTATGGTHTITAAGDTTSAIAFDAQAQTIEQRIQEDIAAINDIIVVQTSNSPRTFLIEMVDPLFGINFSVNTGSLTGGTATMTGLDDGGDEITAWTRAATLAQGVHQQGNYDTWQLSSTQNHTPDGKYSLFIDPGFVGATSNRLGGAQQVVNVVPGQVYQASIWVRPTQSTIRVRLGIFGVGEEIIALSAKRGETFTANTWNQITIPDLVMPDGINRIIFRIACTNTGPSNPGGFYLDDAALLEGLVPTTIGDIWQTLLDDCTLDHAGDARGAILEWVDYSSFDAVNDSNGTPWNHDDLSFVARWGSNMFHVLDDTFTRGYEAELVRKATPAGGKTHDFHLYNPGGRDDSPSAAIHTGQPLTGGDALHRNPSSTAALVVGENGEFTEDTDAPSLASFGRLETFISDNEASGSLSRQLLADNLFASENANRRAVSFNVLEAPGVPRPGVHYRLGDTIPMTMAPTLAKEDRRVQRYDYVNTQPTQYVVVGSRVLQGEAAAFDLIGRIWRRMNRPGKFEPKPAGPLASEGGGAPTVVVAASDATDFSKSKADFICTGVADEGLINQVISTISEGRVLLTEGTFSLDGPIVLDTTGIHLQGMGRFVTQLICNVGTQLIDLTDECTVSDLRLVGPTTAAISSTSDANRCEIRNVVFDVSGICVLIRGDEWKITNNHAQGLAFFPSYFVQDQDTYFGTQIIGNHARGALDMGDGTEWAVVGNILWEEVIANGGMFGHIASNTWRNQSGTLLSGGKINISNFTTLEIADNIIPLGGNAGIWLDTCEDVIISDNRVAQMDRGIYLVDCTNTIATNNSAKWCFTANYEINGGSNNTLIGNIAIASDTDNYRINSDDCLIASNKSVVAAGFSAAVVGINIAGGNNNAVYANYLGDASAYSTADYIDNGTGTLTMPDANGQFTHGGGGGPGGGVSSSKVVFSQAGVLTTGTGAFKLPFTLDAEIVSVQLAVNASPVGADLIVDVNKNGTTVFTTQANRPTVPDGDADGVGAETTPDVTSISEGDYLTVDIDQVGSTNAGSDLTVVVEWRPT